MLPGLRFPACIQASGILRLRASATTSPVPPWPCALYSSQRAMSRSQFSRIYCLTGDAGLQAGRNNRKTTIANSETQFRSGDAKRFLDNARFQAVTIFLRKIRDEQIHGKITGDDALFKQKTNVPQTGLWEFTLECISKFNFGQMVFSSECTLIIHTACSTS